MQTTHMTAEEIRRLSWRCRRGLLELDIILQKFCQQFMAHLAPAELNAFNQLLDLPDNEFLDILTHRKSLNDAQNIVGMPSLLEKIQVF